MKLEAKATGSGNILITSADHAGAVTLDEHFLRELSSCTTNAHVGKLVGRIVEKLNAAFGDAVPDAPPADEAEPPSEDVESSMAATKKAVAKKKAKA